MAGSREGRDAARDLAAILRRAHEARNANAMMAALNDLGPVPAIREREENPQMMIYAYALLVDDLLKEKRAAQQDAPPDGDRGTTGYAVDPAELRDGFGGIA